MEKEENNMFYTPVHKIPVGRIKTNGRDICLEVKNPRTKITEDVPFSYIVSQAIKLAREEGSAASR